MIKIKKIGVIRKNILITALIFTVFIIAESFYNLYNIINIDLNKVIETISNIIGVILGIVFALYFFVLEMFRNKYPLEFVRIYVEKNLKIILGQCILNLLINMFILVFSKNYFCTSILCIVQFIYICFLLYKIFENYNIFCSDNIVQNEKRYIDNIITSDNIDIDKIIDSLIKLNKYSEEAFYSNNLEIVNKVINLNKELIYKLIKTTDSHLIESELGDEKFKKISGLIVNNIMYQIKFGINHNNTNFVEESFYIVEDIIKKVILCQKLSLFNKFEENINSIYDYCNDINQIYCLSIIRMYSRIGLDIITDEIKLESTKNEWLDKILKNLNNYSFLNNIQYNYNTINLLIKIYTAFTFEFIKNNNKEYYKKLLEIIMLNVERNNIMSKDDNNLSCFVIYNIAEVLNENKKYQWIEEYCQDIYNIAIRAIETNNDELVLIILSCYKLFENCNINIQDIVNKHRYDLSKFAIDLKDEWITVFLPDYKKMVEKDKNNQILINKISDDFKGLLYKSLIKKKVEAIFYIFETINDIAKQYEKSDRDKQKVILDIYSKFMSECIRMTEEESFNVALEQMNTIIEFWDKENNISVNLAETIIMKLYELSKVALTDGQVNLCISANKFLFFVEKELKFALNNTDIYLKILQYMFQIAIDSIEVEEDKVLKNISNILGWLGKEIIDSGKYDTFIEIIDIVTEIINLYCDINIDDNEKEITNKTIIFFGTLFIILGAYCLSERKDKYLNVIMENGILRLNNKSFLKYSKKLRYFESERWNEVIKNEPKKNIDKFYGYVERPEKLVLSKSIKPN